MITLFTHRSFFIRAAAGILVGTIIMFGVWAVSRAWMPEGFFMALPRPSIAGCQQNMTQTIATFTWNLVLTGGLTVIASLCKVNRFPYGYVIPWLIFAIYGGSLGTNSFNCPNSEGPLPISVTILWTRAGFREIVRYVLIAAALANQCLWRQPSSFKTQVEKVRSWREFKLNAEIVFELCTAIILLAWGAIVEMMP